MPIVFPAPPDDETLDVLLGDNAEFFKVNRELTHAYVAENPVQVILVPTVVTVTTSGGRQRTSGVPRSSQTCRLVEYATVVGYGGLRTTEGSVHQHRWVLLMDWDAEVELHDRFTHDGADWEVVDFEPKNGYETRAVVDKRG